MSDPIIYGGDLCIADTQEGAGGVAAVDVTPGLKGLCAI